jgi:hypothetical protein
MQYFKIIKLIELIKLYNNHNFSLKKKAILQAFFF